MEHVSIPVHWVCIVVDFLLDLLRPYFGFGFKKFIQKHRNNHLMFLLLYQNEVRFNGHQILADQSN
jgi:hypothetical protein